MGKRVAVVIRHPERHYEGLRTSLGLLLEQHLVSMFVLGHEIEATEAYLDNAGFIDEMGGARFSDVAGNVREHGFRPIAAEDIGAALAGNELILPF